MGTGEKCNSAVSGPPAAQSAAARLPGRKAAGGNGGHILVTLFGIVMLVKPVQPLNASDGIYASQPNSILEPLPIGPAVFKFVQPENAELPILVTLFGIVMLVKLVQL